jgi:hypothetical protein
LKVLQDSFEIYVSREGAFLPMWRKDNKQ